MPSSENVYVTKGHFVLLGLIILEEGVEVDPEKIKAINEGLLPKTVTEFKSFLGLEGSYRIFIEGCLIKVHPISSLQNKGVKFE